MAAITVARSALWSETSIAYGRAFFALNYVEQTPTTVKLHPLLSVRLRGTKSEGALCGIYGELASRAGAAALIDGPVAAIVFPFG